MGIKCRWGTRRAPRQTQNPAQRFFAGVKRPGRGANHPLPSSAALRMGWNYKSVLVDLEACHGWFYLLYKTRAIQVFFFCDAATQPGSWPPHSWGFLDHTQRRTTVGRTPLDEWSARRRDLYLTAHNTHNRQTSMPPMGFEPTIPAGEVDST